MIDINQKRHATTEQQRSGMRNVKAEGLKKIKKEETVIINPGSFRQELLRLGRPLLQHFMVWPIHLLNSPKFFFPSELPFHPFLPFFIFLLLVSA